MTTMAENSKGTAKRGKGRPFVRGQSGNPTGRPRLPAALKERAQAYSVEMIDTLHELATDKAQPGSVRVSAAIAVLDRGYGKPTAIVHASVGSLADLVAASFARTPAIEGSDERRTTDE